jgi:hypothetical protein
LLRRRSPALICFLRRLWRSTSATWAQHFSGSSGTILLKSRLPSTHSRLPLTQKAVHPQAASPSSRPPSACRGHPNLSNSPCTSARCTCWRPPLPPACTAKHRSLPLPLLLTPPSAFFRPQPGLHRETRRFSSRPARVAALRDDHCTCRAISAR